MTETNAERLESIKDTWKCEDTSYLDNEDIDWLIEQAERAQNLEIQNSYLGKWVDRTENEVDHLEAENKRLREALEFYADETMYGKYKVFEPETRIEADGGRKAHQALEEFK